MKHFLLILIFVVCACSAINITLLQLYNRNFSQELLDSICTIDLLPLLNLWDSIYLQDIGYMYLYIDSTRVYRVYKVNNLYCITKRINK